MFQIVREPHFPAIVHVRVPGEAVEVTFNATFKAIANSDVGTYDLARGEGTEAFLRHVWVGADGIAEEDGSPLAWSEATMSTLLDLPYLRRPLVLAYFVGLAEAARKN